MKETIKDPRLKILKLIKNPYAVSAILNLRTHFKGLNKTENSSNIEKPAADQPGSEDKSASNIPIEKSLFLCNICGISYSFKEHLKLHVERFHLGYFICHLCNKTFLGKSLLDEHLISVHEEKKKILKCIG